MLGVAKRRWRGLTGVLALLAAVSAMTALQRRGLVPLASLAASPKQVAEGHLWLLLSSGLIMARPLVPSALAFVGLAFATFGLCGSRILWPALAIGHTCSTLLAYSMLGLSRTVEPRAFHGLVSAPDYGVSAICAAWLGAVATHGWRGRGENHSKALIVLGCVAAACLAWLLRGRGLNVLDSEHLFAFAIGIGIARALERQTPPSRQRGPVAQVVEHSALDGEDGDRNLPGPFDDPSEPRRSVLVDRLQLRLQRRHPRKRGTRRFQRVP